MADYIKKINNIPIMIVSGAYYGTCSSSYSNSTKSVTSESVIELAVGTTVTVRFTDYSSANEPKLNVNGLGALPIRCDGQDAAATNRVTWGSGAIIMFVYDGTGWAVAGDTGTLYGTCESLGNASSKAVSLGNFAVHKGTMITVAMTAANTNSSPSLTLGSTSGRPIYYGLGTDVPTVANGHSWADASMATFVFDGSAWRLVSTNG
jgi:hypothetical protein